MALKYRIPFSDLRGVEHEVLIFDKNYSDSTVTELTASSPPVTISYKGNRDKFDPLIGSECELNILVTDDLDRFFGREFVTIEEDQYTVDVKLKKTDLFWTGFLLPDRYQEQYLFRPYEIKLRASDGIARLNDKPYGGEGGSHNQTYGDVRVDDSFFPLYDILENTMAFYSSVNSSFGRIQAFGQIIEILDFYEKNQLSDYSTLQQTLVDSNSLFKDGEEDNPQELEPKDAKEVVEGILKSMGCRMYQHPLRNLGITDARWIVERVNAIYHNRGPFKFVDHQNSTHGTYPRTELFNNVNKDDGTFNHPTTERDQTYDPAFDLNQLTTFTEESNAGRNPDNAIIFTNESEPTVEFLPARPDAKVSFTKEYKKEGFQKNGYGKAMTGYISDPFFSGVEFDTSTGNYEFSKAWQPTSTPVPGANISPGSNDSSGIALKSGVSSIYSTSPKKGNTKSDGTDILVDGRAIRLKTKAKLKLANGATANQPATRLLPNNSFPEIYVRVDAGGSTFYAQTNSNNVLIFGSPTTKGFKLFNVKFDEANEFEFEFELPNVGQRGTISIELFPSGQTFQYAPQGPDTQVVYNYMQIVDVKDQNTNIRTYDGLSDVDTSVGRYEKELMFGDGGFPVTNALKFINSTSVTTSDRFKALTPTGNWKAEATSNDEQPLLKSLTRQYMRNLREPSFILSAELWWGNLDADPFHLFLEENLGTNAQRTFTLVGQSIEMDIANRRLDGQWIQQLEEQESPGFIAPGPGLGIPTPGDGDGPVPQPGPIDGQLPNPDGNDFTDEVSIDGFTMGTFNYRVLLDLCAATASSGDQAQIFLPDVNNIQCNQKYQVTAICNGCSNRNAVIQTNPNDSANIAGNNENEVVIPCGTSAVFIKSCSTGDWIRVS